MIKESWNLFLNWNYFFDFLVVESFFFIEIIYVGKLFVGYWDVSCFEKISFFIIY